MISDKLRKIAVQLGKQELDQFMSDFWSKTFSHPFDDRSRIWGNEIIAEVKPFDGKIHISWIQALDPRKGQGGKFMSWICDLADKHQVAMSLAPEPRGDHAMPKSKLISFYSKYGFKKSKYQLMYREPKGS